MEITTRLDPVHSASQGLHLGSPAPGIDQHMRQILGLLGEDPAREGLRGTPKRYAKAMSFLTSGYQADIVKILNGALFTESSREMVMIRDIEFFSMCEHHLLPFFGKAHIAYLPDGKIIGLSKIPRLMDAFARRLQLQERLTCQLADVVEEVLKPKGVAIVLEGYHMCVMMRGVEKQNSFAVTQAMRGVFADDPQKRRDFFDLLNATARQAVVSPAASRPDFRSAERTPS